MGMLMTDYEVKVKEAIEHPSHCTSHPSGIECIEIAQHHNFNIGNTIKYLWRHGLKESDSNVTDLLKARKYIDFEIARLTKKECLVTTAVNRS